MCRQVGENEARKNGFQRPLHSYQILVWFTILVSIVLYLGIVIPFHPDNLTLWVTSAIYAFCFVLGLTNFLWVSLTDPRTLRTKDTIGTSVAGDAVPLKTLSSPDQNSSSPTLPTAEEYIECTKCPALKLPDTKHCNLCQKCVDNFDHHCVYLNTCIGKQNYWPFFTVISCLTIFLAIQLFVTIDWATRYFLNQDDYVAAVADSALTGQGHVLLGIITASIPAGGFGLISSLEGFHIWIIILRTTTYKWILDRRRRRAEAAYEREQRKKGIVAASETEQIAQDEARKKEWQEKMDKEKEERKKREARRQKLEELEAAKRDQSQIDEPSAGGPTVSHGSQASVDLSAVQIHKDATRSDGPPRDEATSLIDAERSSSHHTKGDSAAISIHVSPSRRRESSTEIVTNDGRDQDEDAVERRLSMLGVATLDEVGHDKFRRPGVKHERQEKRKSDESSAETSEIGTHTTSWTKQSDRE